MSGSLQVSLIDFILADFADLQSFRKGGVRLEIVHHRSGAVSWTLDSRASLSGKSC